MVPNFISNIFKKISANVTGAVLFTIGLFLFISFASYDSFDPSANIERDAVVKNLGGTLGAYISGPTISFVGFGYIILTLTPIIWGWKLIKEKKVTHVWLRITTLVICLPVLSGFLSNIDPYFSVPEHWPSTSFGGFIGAYLNDKTSPVITPIGYFFTSFVLSAAGIFFVLALSLEQWKSIITKIYEFISAIFSAIFMVTAKIKSMLFNESDEGISEKAIRKKRSLKKIITRDREEKDKKTKGKKTSTQSTMDLEMRDKYQIPPLNLLKTSAGKQKNNMSETALSQNAELLEKVLDDFGIKGKIVEVSPGPVVTLYALEPSPGTKSSRVIGLSDDIARSMSAVSARISVIAGKNAIGIELPNSTRETVFLKEMLESDEYKNTKSKLPLALGKDISGSEIIIDLSRTPHLLVAGTTGSGKSVAINAMILSLLYKYSPDECKFIMVDPKMLELSVYQDIPHLLSPVVTEPGKAVVALKWTVKEMENRYRLMSTLGVRNIEGYNTRIKEAKKNGEHLTRSVQTGFDPDTGSPIIEKVPLDMNPLPFIVVIVDEMADLMLVGGKDIESSVQRLAQMARAAGIHIILATQRPSVDVITGVIKANFPTRISFQVTSKIDSRTILGEQGAEQLLGMGDMLYMAGGSRISRIHGPFVDDSEVENVVSFIKKQGSPSYIEDVTKDDEEDLFSEEMGGERDELYNQAVEIVCRDDKASTSYVQRSLKIGYNRAANIIETMEKDGIISPANHVGKREVLRK